MGWQPYNSDEKPKNEPPSPYGAPPGGQSPFGQQPQQQPFGQQQPPFGQQPQQQPFGQQPSPYGPGYYGGPYAPTPPKRGRSSCTVVAIVLVVVALLCVVCCVGAMAYVFSNDQMAYVGWQASMASGSTTAVDAGLVCKDSQAQRFSEAFHQRYYVDYTGGTTLSITNTTQQGDSYIFEGQITGSSSDSNYNPAYFGDYRATFVMGKDKGFLGLFGHCIEEIHQTQPALNVQ